MGNKYGKTFAQVILRYQIEYGVIVVPNSRQYVMGFRIIWNEIPDNMEFTSRYMLCGKKRANTDCKQILPGGIIKRVAEGVVYV